MTMFRIVSGNGTADRAAILHLSGRLAAAAQDLGLAVLANKASRCASSPSRYLTLRDAGARRWLVRVSNHRMPVHNGNPVPHLDLVSLDGQGGLHEATAFLHRIAMGRVAWFDAADPAHRRALRRSRRRRR